MILTYEVISYNEDLNGRFDVYSGVDSYHVTTNRDNLPVIVVNLDDGSNITFGPNFHPEKMDMFFTLRTETGYSLSEDTL